jgi:hypothetical protein
MVVIVNDVDNVYVVSKHRGFNKQMEKDREREKG